MFGAFVHIRRFLPMKDVRIGIPREYFIAGMDPEVKTNVENAIRRYETMGCRIEEIKTGEIARNAEQLHALYLQTHKNARLRLVTLPVAFLPTLAERLGDDLRFTVLRRDDELLGFVTTVKDGETAVGYYIGFDRKANKDIPIYFRLLQSWWAMRSRWDANGSHSAARRSSQKRVSALGPIRCVCGSVIAFRC